MGSSSDLRYLKSRGDLGALTENLKRTSDQIQPLMNRVLSPSGGPEPLYKAAKHLIAAGGKMLRPYLALRSCEVVGGKVEAALPSAAAVELLHTFTLIHDDVMDHDRVRRGVRSVHAQWNVPVAIVAGDLLFAKVYELIVRHTDSELVPPERKVRAVDLLTEAAVQVCEGQMLDVAFSKRDDVTDEEYIEMVGKKTSSLFKTAGEVGGVLGGGSEEQIERLGRFGYLCGIAFQISDDVLGLVADERALGKPVGSDLRERKKTLPLIYALRDASPKEKKGLLSALEKKATPRNIEKARRIIDQLGSTHYALEKAKGFIKEGQRQLSIFPPNQARDRLLLFSNLLVERKL